MKLTTRIVQIFVGVLFIVSGLVKANDPLGLSYKMQEFFELWSAGLSQKSFIHSSLESLHQNSLALSIIMITLEIAAGVALLTGWMKKFVLWGLLLLIIFFTFLTGYAYLSGKFTNCGCFGDCFPISPLTSFFKDIILLIMILFLLISQKHISPTFKRKLSSLNFNFTLVVVSIILSLLLQWYVLNYLPFADCLAFKKGNNIPEQMKPPKNAVRDSTVLVYIYEKDGKRYEWAWNELPKDYQTYKYIDRLDKLVRKGNAEPSIKGFSLSGATVLDSTSGSYKTSDSTSIVLSQSIAIIGFGLDTLQHNEWLNDLKEVMKIAGAKNIPVYFSTNERDKFLKAFAANNITIQVFGTDYTPVRTAARTNPAFYILKQGTIFNKYGYRKMNDLLNDVKKL